MSRSLEILKIYCKAVLSEDVSPWTLDPKCVNIPWRECSVSPPGRKLRFGIISDNDGEVSVHPPLSRALALTKSALEAAGHSVFEWTPLNHPAMVQELNQSFHTLGAAAILDLTFQNEEPVYGSMKPYEETYRKGEADTLGPTKLRDMILRRNTFQRQYMDAWNATASSGSQIMDGLICPASIWTAPRLGITQSLFCVNFTGFLNILDYPACTFPVTFADKDVDKKRGEEWKALSEWDAKLQADYEPGFYDGTPVALQMVGRRMEDEKVLEMVGVVSEVLKGAGISAGF